MITCYVSVDGDDKGTGSAGSPFATLQRARDALRLSRGAGDKGPARVILRGGTHRLQEPLVRTSKRGCA